MPVITSQKTKPSTQTTNAQPTNTVAAKVTPTQKPEALQPIPAIEQAVEQAVEQKTTDTAASSDRPARAAKVTEQVMAQPAQQWRNCRKPHRI